MRALAPRCFPALLAAICFRAPAGVAAVLQTVRTGDRRRRRTPSAWTSNYNCNGDQSSNPAAAVLRNMSVDLAADQWTHRIRDAFSALDAPAIMTVTEQKQIPLLRNFLAHVQHASSVDGSRMDVVNVALDAESLEACTSARGEFSPAGALLHVICLDMVGWLPSDILAQQIVESQVGNCWFAIMVSTKPLLLQAAVRVARHGVFMSDLDVVYYRNILTWIQAHTQPGDVLMTGAMRISGTVFATNASLGFMSTWVEELLKMPPWLYDQSALHNALRKLERRRLQLQEISEQVISQGSKPGGEYGIHYCGTSSLPEKVDRMQKHGDWLVEVPPPSTSPPA